MPTFIIAGPRDIKGHLGMPTPGSQQDQKTYVLGPLHQELTRFSTVLTFTPVIMQFAAPIRVAVLAMKKALLLPVATR